MRQDQVRAKRHCDEEHDRDGTRRVMSDSYYEARFGGWADAFRRMDESVRKAQLTVKRMRRTA